MEMKPTTIDNLPIDASRRYAEDQEKLRVGRPIIEESRLFPGKPGAALSGVPYIPAEFIEWLSLGSRTVWAAFFSPVDYAVHVADLFSYLLIPSLGGSENLQAISDKLELMKKVIPQNKVLQYEYATLCTLVKHLIDASRTFEMIKGRCNQYHKG
jgi:hypothetical protein